MYFVKLFTPVKLFTQANGAFYEDAGSRIGKSANKTKLKVNKMLKHYM